VIGIALVFEGAVLIRLAFTLRRQPAA
jgi:uncharacterized membrane protein HdeD (DUF308 family)